MPLDVLGEDGAGYRGKASQRSPAPAKVAWSQPAGQKPKPPLAEILLPAR
jgi:hypothetical protein